MHSSMRVSLLRCRLSLLLLLLLRELNKLRVANPDPRKASLLFRGISATNVELMRGLFVSLFSCSKLDPKSEEKKN